MDHVMNKIQDYYDLYLEDFAEDYIRKGYKKISDSPRLDELKLLAKSINLYRDYFKLPRINLKSEIMNEIERRNYEPTDTFSR
ncbi:hypothetical protein ACHAL6_00460 [Proteiniclasticum sp. C24MP]|uniref:hypothetical protein n=1 Tax=Proteiniclasticum sp. C24MP TaxID=3374101 RepID=UPI0037544336